MKPRRPTTLYPLGKNMFASVKTQKGEVKIQIRHYAMATNIKGGRDVPTQKKSVAGLERIPKTSQDPEKLGTRLQPANVFSVYSPRDSH